jgi:hypothetical protein
MPGVDAFRHAVADAIFYEQSYSWLLRQQICSLYTRVGSSALRDRQAAAPQPPATRVTACARPETFPAAFQWRTLVDAGTETL